MDANIKKDIFVAIISSGSVNQKERWLETANQAYDWVMADETAKAPKAKPRKKK